MQHCSMKVDRMEIGAESATKDGTYGTMAELVGVTGAALLELLLSYSTTRNSTLAFAPYTSSFLVFMAGKWWFSAIFFMCPF